MKVSSRPDTILKETICCFAEEFRIFDCLDAHFCAGLPRATGIFLQFPSDAGVQNELIQESRQSLINIKYGFTVSQK